MDGLDLLKQHWDKKPHFPKIDKEEIQHMLHKSSCSIVKWIFIISIFELSLGIALSLLLPGVEKPMSPFEFYFSLTLGIIFRVAILFFIYSFFTHYRQIRNTTDTRTLLKTILKTRQSVDNYIKFNIYFFIFFMAVSGLRKIGKAFIEKSVAEGILMTFLVIIVVTPLILLVIYLMKNYYRILYRRLMNKLNDNYEELVQIENYKIPS